jgi:TatA/E family protein of Tat protein translocase
MGAVVGRGEASYNIFGGGLLFSFEELLLLSAIVLVVFGPDKLPEVARVLGRAAKEFRKVTYTARRAWDEIGQEMALQEALEKDRHLEEKQQAAAEAGSRVLPTAPASGGALSGETSADMSEAGEKRETGVNNASVSAESSTAPSEPPGKGENR